MLQIEHTYTMEPETCCGFVFFLSAFSSQHLQKTILVYFEVKCKYHKIMSAKIHPLEESDSANSNRVRSVSVTVSDIRRPRAMKGTHGSVAAASIVWRGT